MTSNCCILLYCTTVASCLLIVHWCTCSATRRGTLRRIETMQIGVLRPYHPRHLLKDTNGLIIDKAPTFLLCRRFRYAFYLGVIVPSDVYSHVSKRTSFRGCSSHGVPGRTLSLFLPEQWFHIRYAVQKGCRSISYGVLVGCLPSMGMVRML